MKRQKVSPVVLTALALALVGALQACTAPDPHAIDYQSAGRAKAVKAPSLATPPDFMNDPRAAAEAPASGASLSGYSTGQGTLGTSVAVLPRAAGLHLERDGTQRWLVIEPGAIPSAQLWSRLRAFWQDQGFFLTEDVQQRGVMQTDWNETHARLDQGIIRNTLSLAVNNAYVTGERHRYRTRTEAGPNGQTYVFISEQGLHEVLTGPTNETSAWTTRPNDPGLEADYLRRLEQALAQAPQPSVMEAQQAEAASAARATAVPRALGPVTRDVSTTTLPAGAEVSSAGLELRADYDTSWTRVGQALDRGNFTVDGRDKMQGLYSIRYADPNNLGTDAQGFWNQLFHGKHEKVATPFKINVKAITPTQTQVAVLDANGKADTSPLGQRIMRLLVAAM